MNHVALADGAAAGDGDRVAREAEAPRHAGVERGLGHERDGGGAEGAAVGAEHRAVEDGLRRRDRGVGVAHRAPGDEAALDDQLGLDAEEGGPPENEVGQLPRLD